MEKNSQLEKTTCPKCKSKLDAATHAGAEEKAQPKKNDLTVCLYCSSILIYNSDLLLREATEKDLKKLDEDLLFELKRAKAMAEIIMKDEQKKYN